MRSCFLSFGLSWSSRTYPRWLRCGKDGCLRPFNSLPASRPAGESRPRGGTAATWTPPPLAKGKMLFCCQCLQLDFGVGLPPSKKSLQKNEYSSREDFASPAPWLAKFGPLFSVNWNELRPLLHHPYTSSLRCAELPYQRARAPPANSYGELDVLGGHAVSQSLPNFTNCSGPRGPPQSSRPPWRRLHIHSRR